MQMVLEYAASVVEGIAWCISEYVSMPVGQRIVGAGLLVLGMLLVYYSHADESRSRAKALQAMVAALSGMSMAIAITMGHSMPEMEFLFLWLPVTGWLSVTLAYLFNKRIYFTAFKPIAFPAELAAKTREISSLVGLEKQPVVGVFDSGKIEVLSAAGRESVLLVSVGALDAFSEKELEAVLFHEAIHLKHGDSLYKLVCTAGVFTLFAPIALLARRLIAAEHELAANRVTAKTYPNEFISAAKVLEEKGDW